MPYNVFFYEDDSDDMWLMNAFLQTRKRRVVRNRHNLLNEYDRFRLSKMAVLDLLELVNHKIAHKTKRYVL